MLKILQRIPLRPRSIHFSIVRPISSAQNSQPELSDFQIKHARKYFKKDKNEKVYETRREALKSQNKPKPIKTQPEVNL